MSTLRQKGLDSLATVNRSAIPYYQKIARNMLEQMLQKLHHGRTFEGFFPYLNIEPALFRNPADDRKMFTTQFMAQNRSFFFGRIGAARKRQQVKAGFISKYYCPAFFIGFFLSSGHRSAHHCLTASSFLCDARNTGFWHVQPHALSIFPTWLRW